MAPLLEIKDFHYYYGGIHALKGISMYVNEGETVVLIGSNGAGKTTTLRSISGLVPAKGMKAGEIFFQGKKINGMAGDKIAALGIRYVFEGRHIFSKLTVTENLLAGAYLRKDKNNVHQDIKKIYKLFPRLEERKNQLGGTLSGGEQQMLAIARAIIAKPKIILFDEPSLGLAPLIVKEVFAAIREIRDEGTTILLVEQNSRLGLNTADRGYVMKNGEIVLADTCENLLRNEEVQKAYLGAKQS
ncbi:MAG: ABC transporter ATP-binding protein [Thermoanaerobacteraceae bacterium]|nr:ABC transporter ATP-binding protein [Thermoanaerobacteraceae bacterium]